jgi:hypothetical protein
MDLNQIDRCSRQRIGGSGRNATGTRAVLDLWAGKDRGLWSKEDSS